MDAIVEEAILRQFDGVHLDDTEDRTAQDRDHRVRGTMARGTNGLFLGACRVDNAVRDPDRNRVQLHLVFIDLN
jgi:hypothetical protein